MRVYIKTVFYDESKVYGVGIYDLPDSYASKITQWKAAGYARDPTQDENDEYDARQNPIIPGTENFLVESDT